jgi:hypothetical protein
MYEMQHAYYDVGIVNAYIFRCKTVKITQQIEVTEYESK